MWELVDNLGFILNKISFAVLFSLHVMLQITSWFHPMSMMYFCNHKLPFQKEIVSMLITSRMPVSWQISSAWYVVPEKNCRASFVAVLSFVCCSEGAFTK